MYEPKYRLNKKDAQRWHDLLVRHCLEMPTTPGGTVKRRRKYPPLTPAENIEFEKLTRKRSRKIDSHPKMKASIARSRRLCRRADALMERLQRLMKRVAKRQVKIDVDRKK